MSNALPKEPDINMISSNIKLLRTLMGISQEKLAGEILLARSTYSAYETGAKVPDLHTLDALSMFYNINVETLVFHDISKGALNSIYVNINDEHYRKVLSKYQSLSTISKGLVMERLKILLHREALFFYFNDDGTIKKR